jgi:hypothetical protein
MAYSDPGQMGQQRRKFTAEEDDQVRTLVESMGTRSWEEIARFMDGRSARQCRDRFKNYLVDSLVIDPWTPQEDELVIRQFNLIGPKWVQIGQLLSGRSGNNVKNRWHKHLCKIYHRFERPKDLSAREVKEEQLARAIVEETAPPPQPKLTISDAEWPWLFRSIETPESPETPWSSIFPHEDSFI